MTDEANSILYLKKGFAQAVEVQLEKEGGVPDDVAPAPTEIVVNWKESLSDATNLLQKTLSGGGCVWEPDGKTSVIGITIDAADSDALVVGMVLTQIFITVDGTEYATEIFNTKVEATLS